MSKEIKEVEINTNTKISYIVFDCGLSININNETKIITVKDENKTSFFENNNENKKDFFNKIKNKYPKSIYESVILFFMQNIMQ